MSESSTYLSFREGASDKVYNVHIKASGDGFVVNFEYGRRGAALNAGTKTAEPVALEKATKIAEKLLKEKRAKGYTEAEGGTPYEGHEASGQDTGIRVQLLNPIEDDIAAKPYLSDPSWWMQTKYDGVRSLLLIEGDTIQRTNRKGFVVPVAIEVAEVARTRLAVTGRTVLDGEMLGTTYAPFDLLVYNGTDLRDRPYAERLALLETLVADAVEWSRLHTYRTAEEKRQAYDKLRDAGEEGVVFKRHAAPYVAGRPNSGGDQIKRKFVATCSVIVAGHSKEKRSVQMELLDAASGQRVPVGNVTIPPNFGIPAVGAVVEVRYLYGMRGGSLIQPIYAGVRDDIDVGDCTTDQIQYKGETRQAA